MKYAVSIGLIQRGEKHHFYGIVKSEETKEKMGKAKRNSLILTFVHKSGIIEICTQYELYSKYNLDQSNLNCVVNGSRKMHKGWSIKND